MRGTSDDRPATHPAGADDLFAGPGEARAAARAVDWAATPLGPVEGWPPVLRHVVRVVLASPFAISLWCGPSYTLLYNEGYCRVLGAKHPLAFGRPGASAWAEIWPALEPQFEGVRNGGPPVFAESVPFVIERRDGGAAEEGWFTYALSAVRDDDGAVVALLNVVSETTERVRAERTLANMFEASPVVMAVYSGPEHVITYVNPTWERVVGKPGALGRPLRDVFPEMAGTEVFTQLDRVYTTREPYSVSELRLPIRRWPDAPIEESYWNFVWQPQAPLRGIPMLDETASGVPDVGGAEDALDILVHAIDVTDQVRARREAERLLGESEAARADAERARAAAESAGRLKSEFLATMSHEFRTPLNAILGYAQLLDMGVLGATTPSQHEHLERLQASARHLLQLVDDVLDVAKVDADRLQVRHDVLATGAAVASALALVQPQATARGVRIEDHGVPGPGVPYVGDEHRVRQILVNLLSNAIKFTPTGGTVTIGCGTAAEPNPGVHPGGAARAGAVEAAGGSASPWTYVRVQDTGPGIHPNLRSRLFEPFVQGDGALTRAHGGTGLGLAISRRLARLMGGDLVLDAGTRADDSRAGASPPGATFTLWLPAAAGAPAGRPRPEAESGFLRRTPAGMPAVTPSGPSSAPALAPAAFAVVYALGTRLGADAETVAGRYVAALRDEAARSPDGSFPGAATLSAAQLRDHVTPQVSLISTQLATIGETLGRAPELLADGAQLQRVMAELHGAQRHRLGWSEADISREMALLRAEVERSLAGALPNAGDVGPEVAAGVDPAPLDRATIDAAAAYAASVTRHVLEQTVQTALRAYRFARAASMP